MAGSIGLGPRKVCAGPVRNGIVCSVFPWIFEEVEAASCHKNDQLQLTRPASTTTGATTTLYLRDAPTVNAYSILLQHKENLDMPYEVMAH